MAALTAAKNRNYELARSLYDKFNDIDHPNLNVYLDGMEEIAIELIKNRAAIEYNIFLKEHRPETEETIKKLPYMELSDRVFTAFIGSKLFGWKS